MDPKIIIFFTNFGAISGAILGPKTAPKSDQKWDQFWNPLPPPHKGPNEAILGIKRDWNYIPQRKGGIYILATTAQSRVRAA